MLDLHFADDARQRDPSRLGMDSLIGTGCIHVPGENVRDLEREIDSLSEVFHFPPGPEGEFKWSPGRELWMRDNLIEDEREKFFLAALRLAREAGTSVSAVVSDESYRTAMADSDDHPTDVTRLLLERIEWRLRADGRTGALVVDRPSGGRQDEDQFLSACLETVTEGTKYLALDRLAVNVLSTPSKLVRLLQLADVVTGCTVSHVAGEGTYSPPLFEAIKPMFTRDRGRIGGIGLKLHPMFKFGNLYHWLVGDEVLWRRNIGIELPTEDYPYAEDPLTP